MTQRYKFARKIASTFVVMGTVLALGSPPAQAVMQGKGGGNGKGGGGGGGGGTHILHRLGSLSGPVGSTQTWGMNELGWVIGWSETPAGVRHAFLVVPQDTDGDGLGDTWHRDDDGDGFNDLMIDIGAVSGNRSAATGVNAFGQVAGVVDGRAFVWEDLNFNGLSDPGEMISIPGTEGADECARGINDAGQTVIELGYSAESFVLAGRDTDGDGKADLWFEDLDGDGANDLLHYLGHIFAFAINEAGVVTGFNSPSGSNAFAIYPEDIDGDGTPDRWFRDEDGNGSNDLLVDLGRPNGFTSSKAYALNNLGQFVGLGALPPKGKKLFNMHAFVWEVDASGWIAMSDLGSPLGSYEFNNLLDTNDSSAMVGLSRNFAKPARGFFFTSPSASVQNITQLVTNSGGLKMLPAAGINNLGVICGWIEDDGQRGAYVAAPIDLGGS